MHACRSRSLARAALAALVLAGLLAANAAYSRLKPIKGWARAVRAELATPKKRRHIRRRSLLYFAQLSDFQLSDEESPARVEALDLANSDFVSAWRPQEAFEPFTVDEGIRQVNRFDRSPLRNRRKRRARMALSITTGDSAAHAPALRPPRPGRRRRDDSRARPGAATLTHVPVTISAGGSCLAPDSVPLFLTGRAQPRLELGEPAVDASPSGIGVDEDPSKSKASLVKLLFLVSVSFELVRRHVGRRALDRP